MKKYIWILVLTFILGGCVGEGENHCPDDMCLSFVLVDEYESGTYDTRIANEVALYFFREKQCVNMNPDPAAACIYIPYSNIANGGKFMFRKTGDIAGDLNMLAYAMPVDGIGTRGSIPTIQPGDQLDNSTLSLGAYPGGGDSDFQPYHREVYLATEETVERRDTYTEYQMQLSLAACRLIVNVTDGTGQFDGSSVKPEIIVTGSMSGMNMNREGIGVEASVHCEMSKADTRADSGVYTTGKVGIMPSSEGQTLSLDIMYGGTMIARLNTEDVSVSGGYIVVNYSLSNTYFEIVVNNFRKFVANVEM